jgi:hypothetical protein
MTAVVEREFFITNRNIRLHSIFPDKQALGVNEFILYKPTMRPQREIP